MLGKNSNCDQSKCDYSPPYKDGLKFRPDPQSFRTLHMCLPFVPRN